MKKTVIATTLVVIAFGFSLAQKKPTHARIRTKAVPAATIANLPAGKTYVVDLRHKETIYTSDGDGTDFSRVTVRTAGSDTTMAELLKNSETKVSGQLAIGRPPDLRRQKLPTVGGSMNFKCGESFCFCIGDEDCNKMFSGSACTGVAWCDARTGYCYCQRRA
jgi:hypothetical protein